MYKTLVTYSGHTYYIDGYISSNGEPQAVIIRISDGIFDHVSITNLKALPLNPSIRAAWENASKYVYS